MRKYYSKILRKYSNILVLGLLTIALVNCESIIAEDIEGEEITTILPLQDAFLTTNSVNFKWSPVEFADEYRIQIVTPNFVNPITFTVDSLVIATNVSFVLTPNDYQWRVKALNNISETAYTEEIDFTVDEVIELTDQIIILNTPIDNVYLNSIQLNFTWNFLSAAESYLFQLVKGDEFSNEIIEQATSTSNFYLPTTQTLDDDLYTWKVKAINSFSETAFVFRNFSFDTTLPNTPTLLSPANEEISTVDTHVSWNLGVDTGNIQSPTTSVLEISVTNDFASLFDSIEINETELSYTFTTTGVFYWRVKAFDEAGNIGLYSEIREVTIE